jgi:hypothetical protein
MMGYPDPDFDDDYDDGYPPSADPAIRLNYEAALGRFILAHNEIDRHLTLLLEKVLDKLGNPTALKGFTSGMFKQRLDRLAILQAMPLDLRLRGLNIAEINELNEERNKIAHGHFEQNIYDGDYELITNKARFSHYTAERLDALTERMMRQIMQLRPTVIFYEPPILPPEAMLINPS